MNNEIQLLLMVKNGADLITQSLESFVDQVDRFVILDTGSTDKTINLIEEFRTKYNQNVTVITEEFQGFDKSRNSLLDHASSFEGTWSLMIDDSFILIGDLRKSLTSDLTEKLYSIGISVDTNVPYHGCPPSDIDAHDPGLDYCFDTANLTRTRYLSPRLFRTKYLKEIRYVGEVHETPNCISSPNPGCLRFVLNDRKCEAHVARTVERNVSDLEILSNMKCLNDNDEARRLYYIGMTKYGLYKAGKCHVNEAYDALFARVLVNGDPEEKMFTLLILGGLCEILKNKEIAIKFYIYAADVFPARDGESYYYAYLLSGDLEYLRLAYLKRKTNVRVFRFPFVEGIYGSICDESRRYAEDFGGDSDSD